mmetsp:Transcript_982/g.1728  ORF Transcript_982/g.1728 Transcript_982/m.1728 type:complete len:86 (-) Transcript_982:167-424(-)
MHIYICSVCHSLTDLIDVLIQSSFSSLNIKRGRLTNQLAVTHDIIPRAWYRNSRGTFTVSLQDTATTPSLLCCDRPTWMYLSANH